MAIVPDNGSKLSQEWRERHSARRGRVAPARQIDAQVARGEFLPQYSDYIEYMEQRMARLERGQPVFIADGPQASAEATLIGDLVHASANGLQERYDKRARRLIELGYSEAAVREVARPEVDETEAWLESLRGSAEEWE